MKRISQLSCMSLTKQIEDEDRKIKTIKCDFPEFMKYTREIPYTKDGKELPYEIVSKNKKKLRNRINYDLQCPMNWLEEWLDKIQNISSSNTVPTKDFFIKMQGEANRRQMSKIQKLAESWDECIKYYATSFKNDNDTFFSVVGTSEEIIGELSKIKIGNIVTINRLIELSLGLSNEVGASFRRKYDPSKYTRKVLNLLYKSNKDKFLANFIVKSA